VGCSVTAKPFLCFGLGFGGAGAAAGCSDGLVGSLAARVLSLVSLVAI